MNVEKIIVVSLLLPFYLYYSRYLFRQYELNKCRPVSTTKQEGDKYTAEVLIFFPDYTSSFCTTYHSSKRKAKAQAKKNAKWVKKYGNIHKNGSVETLVEEISCFI